jgi:glutamyl-tRNA reductase
MVSAGLRAASRHLPGPPATGAAGHGEGVPAPGCPVDTVSSGIASEVAAALPEPGELTGKRVLVLGAGSMSALAANTAARRGASTLFIANRNRLYAIQQGAKSDVDK